MLRFTVMAIVGTSVFAGFSAAILLELGRSSRTRIFDRMAAESRSWARIRRVSLSSSPTAAIHCKYCAPVVEVVCASGGDSRS
jgi:hypothetical protein